MIFIIYLQLKKLLVPVMRTMSLGKLFCVLKLKVLKILSQVLELSYDSPTYLFSMNTEEPSNIDIIEPIIPDDNEPTIPGDNESTIPDDNEPGTTGFSLI